MTRIPPAALGLAGFALAAVTLAVYAGFCDSPAILLLVGYAAGVVLLGAGLLLGLRPGLVLSIVICAGLAVIAAVAAYMGFWLSFARCFEF